MSSVSVVIPCYKYGRYLEECVASALDDQEGVDVRVLIIDDASPDDSAEVARKIAASRSAVEVIVHDTNKGNIATFNEGLLDWADGDYCIMLSADDRLTPGALRRACELLDANPGAGFAYGHALWWSDRAPVPVARQRVRGWSVMPGPEWIEHLFRHGQNPIISPEVVVRTSLQKRVGGYDPALPKAADMEIFMRFAAHADVGFIRGADQAFHRVHDQNMSKSVSPLMDLIDRRSVFEVVLDRYGAHLADTKSLSGMVHRQLSREAVWAAARVYDPGRLRQSELARRVLGGGMAEDDEDLDNLMEFALDCWPQISTLRVYRALQSRKGVGLNGIWYLFSQKAQWWTRRQLWKRRGF